MNLSALRVAVEFGKAVPWWWRYAYLIPDIFRQHPELEAGFTQLLQGKDTRFAKMIETQVTAYVEGGKMPPADIAAPILNIAEDIVAGRQPTIRAGDYIALQNHMRAQKTG